MRRGKKVAGQLDMEPTGAIALLDEIMVKAIELQASDIHLEPREDFLRVRYRVDGLLQDAAPVPKAKQAALLSRVKVIVNLDIAENRLPQDGRAELKLGRHQYDLRVSTLPTVHGEKVVIRILSRRQIFLKLEELGMEDDDLQVYRELIRKKNGLILLTGPTGSGKTTTLYATLSQINTKEVNVMTIEDPVEYQLPGINQIQVNNKAGLTFSGGLRSILRQDPDIIMVGEIRDLETARIAVQAALTGHLVFSTLHTNDAAGSVTRLVEMGIEDYLVRSVLLGALAQRLVRKKSAAGYKGRTGIYELMVGSGSAARTSLLDNGRAKVERDVTTIEEVARVVCLED